MNHPSAFAWLSLLAGLLLTATSQAQEDLPYTQVKDLVFGEVHGTG